MIERKDMIVYICKNGHIKYVHKNEEFDICNICGTEEAENRGPRYVTKEGK